MSTSKAPSTFSLDQFKGQFYQAMYKQSCTLVQFTKSMDQLFEEIYKFSNIKIQVSYNQWQGRKRAWDEEWNIKDGGPSPETRRVLNELPIWFDIERGVMSLRTLRFGTPSLPVQTLSNDVDTDYVPLQAQDALDDPSMSRVWDAEPPAEGLGMPNYNYDTPSPISSFPSRTAPTSRTPLYEAPLASMHQGSYGRVLIPAATDIPSGQERLLDIHNHKNSPGFRSWGDNAPQILPSTTTGLSNNYYFHQVPAYAPDASVHDANRTYPYTQVNHQTPIQQQPSSSREPPQAPSSAATSAPTPARPGYRLHTSDRSFTTYSEKR
ncbi:hypothetical protein MMC28_000037 [Mycoblastus sanguinarius]|nr:hypothetical protein [Mycoblastus sanguinarius]